MCCGSASGVNRGRVGESASACTGIAWRIVQVFAQKGAVEPPRTGRAQAREPESARSIRPRHHGAADWRSAV